MRECVCADTNQSVHSERRILGLILNGQISAHDTGLSEEHFSEAVRREIFNLFLKIENSGFQVDLVSAFDYCPDRIDMMTVLSQEAAVDGAITQQHIENVKRTAQRRMLHKVFAKAANALKDPFADDNGITIEAISTAEEIISKSSSSNAIDAKSTFNDVLSEISSGEPPKAITSGFSAIDDYLSGGFHDGELVVIGARTGVGKSAVMLDMALSALAKGKRVAFFSLEMSRKLIEHRRIANVSGVPLFRITRNAINSNDANRIAISHEHFPFDSWHVFDTVHTLEDIQSEIMRLKSTSGIDIVYVDYLQIIDSEQKSENRTVEVGKISKSLKRLAMKADIPVVTASQIKRLSPGERDRMPILSDLRESGSIEQDSDVVLFLHAESGDSFQPSPNRDLFVAKQRQGELGGVHLLFDGATMRFIPAKEANHATQQHFIPDLHISTPFE